MNEIPDKERREKLRQMSEVCFGGRSKWQKLMKTKGFTLAMVETQMEAMIDMISKGELESDQARKEPNRQSRRNKYVRAYKKRIDKVRLREGASGAITSGVIGRDSEGVDFRGEKILAEQLETGIEVDEDNGEHV